MRSILRPLLIAAATLLSATQLIWMGAFVALCLQDLGRGELDNTFAALVVTWWTGFASAIALARCALSLRRWPRWLWVGVLAGLLASVLVERQLSDPAFNVPYGFFELPILVWIGLGFWAPRLT